MLNVLIAAGVGYLIWRSHKQPPALEPIMTDLSKILTSLEALETVGDGTIVAFTELAALVRANQNDPAAIAAIADRMDAQRAEFAAALVANTIAATEEPPVDPNPVEPPVEGEGDDTAA